MSRQISMLGNTTSLLLLVIFAFWGCNSNPEDTDRLFSKNFLPYPNVLLNLDQDSLVDNSRKDFFMAYRDKDFKRSLAIAEGIDMTSPKDPLQLYRAVCLMANGDFESAIAPLQILAAEPSDYQDAARWYWSLALLKLGKIEACKAQLKTLQNTSTYIRNEAAVLISKLE